MNNSEIRVRVKVLRLDGVASNGEKFVWGQNPPKVGDIIHIEGPGSRIEASRPQVSGLQRVDKDGNNK